MFYASYQAGPAEFLKIGSWGSEEWGNYGILGLVGIFRTAFLLEVGF
jgi:hypothetical protein